MFARTAECVLGVQEEAGEAGKEAAFNPNKAPNLRESADPKQLEATP